MNRKCLLSVIGVLAAISSNVRADETAGFYVGAGLGEVNDRADDFDGNGVGVKLFGGYRFNRYFAAETEYVYTGVLEDTVEDVDVEVESDGFIVSVLGRVPLGKTFTLFGKLGYTLYDQKVTASRGALSLSEKNSDEDLMYGRRPPAFSSGLN